VLFQKGNQSPTLAAALPVAPPRVLSFQGRLTDNFDNPISTSSALRFAIYTDATATDSGTIMAWQEVQSITPDQDGIFNVMLGSNNPYSIHSFYNQSSSLVGCNRRTNTGT